MYYNLSEEQKIFLAHSYAMLKAGYTHDEIVEYWTCNDQEKVQNIVEDLEYIPVDSCPSDENRKYTTHLSLSFPHLSYLPTSFIIFLK